MQVTQEGEQTALLMAYHAAGYAESTNPANAYRLAHLPQVKARVQALQSEHYERVGITADLIREQLARIAMPDLGELYDDHGCIRHPTQMPPELLDAIQSIEMNEYQMPEKVKFEPRIQALSLLMKHMGMLQNSSKNGAAPINITIGEKDARL